VLSRVGNFFHHFSSAATAAVSSQLATQLGTFQCEWWCMERSTLEIPRGWASRGAWWVVLAINVSEFSWFHELYSRLCMAGLLWDGGSREKSRTKVEATSFLYDLSKASLSKGTEHLHIQDLSLELPPLPRQCNGVEGDCSSDQSEKRSSRWQMSKCHGLTQ